MVKTNSWLRSPLSHDLETFFVYFVVLRKQIQESRDPRSPQLKVRTELTAWCVTGSLFTCFIPARDDLDGFTQ